MQGQRLYRLPAQDRGHSWAGSYQLSPWGQGDDQLSAGGRTQNRGVGSVTRLLSAGCLHGQDGSCLPMAPPPGTDCPWLWTRPRDPRLQTGLGVSAEPRFCRQPRPLLTALPQECVTWDGDCVIQETFRVFLGACSGNVARAAIHTAGHILGRLPESWAARGQPWSPSQEDWPPGGHPPTSLENRWEYPRAGIWIGRRKGSALGTEVSHPGPGPCWPNTVFESGRQTWRTVPFLATTT